MDNLSEFYCNLVSAKRGKSPKEVSFAGTLLATNENMEYLNNLCKTLHENINKFRNSPIYISWYKHDVYIPGWFS